MFERVAIIGVGLLGGSFGLALKEQALAKHIIGVTRRDSTAELALKIGAVDEIAPTAAKAVENADFVLLATPMLAMEKVLNEIAPHIEGGAILSDVGSVKSSLTTLVETQFPELRKQFVFAHPIAGGEKHSVVASRSDLFAGKHLILTDLEASAPNKVIAVTQLWEALGCDVASMSSSEHDSVFAYTSHLPHVIAFTLVNNLHHQNNSKTLFNFASAGFYDFTRIASSDPIMWRDICLSNKTEVLASIDQFSAQLETLKVAIKTDDKTKLGDVFSDAKRARDEGLIAKKTKP